MRAGSDRLHEGALVLLTKRRWSSSALSIVAAVALSAPSSAQIPTADQAPQACSDPDRSIALFVERLGPARVGFGLTPESASIPGPTLEMKEGECLSVTLVNDADQKIGLHAHGVDYTVASDGTSINTGCVAPGRSRTFTFSTHGPVRHEDGTIDPGSAGYWHYHDHCMGTPHGTGGIDAGLFGAFIVRREGDPLPDREPFIVVFKDMTINLRKAPHTPIFRADEGERVEFVVIGHGDLMHTFHLHGHRWVDNRTGSPTGLDGSEQVIDNRTLGPADSFGFQVIAGEHVGPGAWMYHCHVQGHSDGGMVGIFLVRNPDGTMTEQERKALRKWRRVEMEHRAHGGGSRHRH